jgi:hypothetical protein
VLVGNSSAHVGNLTDKVKEVKTYYWRSRISSVRGC